MPLTLSLVSSPPKPTQILESGCRTLRSSTSMHPSMPRRTRPRVQSASFPRAPVSAAALPRSAPGHLDSRT
eukprot:scaffold4914_cov152-Pinguiococcus_pyrenoidosus.AAC.2